MRAGFFQYDVAHDRHLNLCHLKRVLEQCQCELLVLPELSLCGYLFETRQKLSCFAENVPFGPSTQEILSRCINIKYGDEPSLHRVEESIHNFLKLYHFEARASL